MTSLGDPAIREAGLAYFYNIARVLNEEFQFYTDKLVNL
jgi:hypothetical protein